MSTIYATPVDYRTTVTLRRMCRDLLISYDLSTSRDTMITAIKAA